MLRGYSDFRCAVFFFAADELLTAPETLADDEKPNQADKALVEEMLTALREEVKEMDRTNWLYEDPAISTLAVKL